MKDDKQDLLEALDAINPAMLDYTEWTQVGMALKHEGFTANVWDQWSQRDHKRYHDGECFKKWGSFTGAGTPVTGGTIITFAKDHGWQPDYFDNNNDEGHELDWDDAISVKEDLVIIDKRWVEGKEIEEPKNWNPIADLTKYLSTIFDSTENVGYVTEAYHDDEKNKWFPKKGCWDRTAGELIQQLNKCKGDIGSVLGDYHPEVGAWIRFNPLDGHGVKNENVSDFRFALVESDSMELDQQNAIIRSLELPVACLVYSGKKSIHAIVRVDASNYDEYRKRVDYLYNVCQKNGLKIDSQNRNPSRLSRMPGVLRNGRKQFLIDTNIGKENWAQWFDWIEGINDDLPEPESLAKVWDNLPELADPLINDVLRQGHKMLIAGPSKAGKSYLLIELCIAIAEGKRWIEWDCSKGKIMYVNLELDRASCLHRFKDVYTALGLKPDNVSNIDIWNLRGKSVPMDKLAPKLIRRAQKKNYIAIVIDPIYKVITGDENSADQMANFCNQFDKVCCDLGAAVIYCHHHSKGSQGSKRSMDRASGSGVFARDPDVLLDLIELELPDSLIKQEKNKATCQACIDVLEANMPGWDDHVSQDDQLNSGAMMAFCKKRLGPSVLDQLNQKIDQACKDVDGRSAWRIEGTLREFPKFPPVNVWFDYPMHKLDKIGHLADVEPEGEKPAWQKAIEKRKDPDVKKKERREALDNAYDACSIEEEVTVDKVAEYLGISERSVWRRINEHGGFETAKRGPTEPALLVRK